MPGANSSGATCYLSGAQCQLLHLPGSTAASQIQGARFQLHQILASAVKELYFMIYDFNLVYPSYQVQTNAPVGKKASLVIVYCPLVQGSSLRLG